MYKFVNGGGSSQLSEKRYNDFSPTKKGGKA